jgi:hypothetical protein
LSCLGSFGPSGDREFLASLYNLLRPQGVLVSTVFCVENAQKLCGEFNVRYSATSTTVVRSVVSYDHDNRLLSISQAVEGEVPYSIPVEEIRLYTRGEMHRLLEGAGFVSVESSVAGPRQDRLIVACRKA